MRKSLVWRAFSVGALFLLLAAGVASSQMSPFPVQNNIAWGGPIQPDVGSTDSRTQTPAPPIVPVEAPPNDASGNSADTPADTSAEAQTGSPASNSASTTTSDNSTVRQLGTPFPLQLQPQGFKIGPFYVPSISDSFYYVDNSAPGQPTQTFVGNSVTASLLASKTLSSGVLAFQAREQMSLANSSKPIFNQSLSLTFNDQLSERWTLNASAQFTYFQNSLLANPEYLLSYTNAGVVQQTLFVQQTFSTAYETNSIALSYAVGERTHLTLSPIIGATFIDQNGGWSSTHQLGGAVGVSRDFTPNLSLGAFYSLTHSTTSGVPGSTGWNSESIGLTFQYLFRQSWSIAGSLAASGQLQAQVWTLTPTGNLRLMKRFSRSSISAAYSRSEASNVFVSSGYFDQGDIGYNQTLGRKASLNVGVGEYRTINTGSHQYGKRASGSVTYQLAPRLSLNGGYSFSHQNGVQTSSFSPFLGNTNTFTVGLTWLLGAQSGL